MSQPYPCPWLTADGVGKSSIITSLIKESFVPNVRELGASCLRMLGEVVGSSDH